MLYSEREWLYSAYKQFKREGAEVHSRCTEHSRKRGRPAISCTHAQGSVQAAMHEGRLTHRDSCEDLLCTDRCGIADWASNHCVSESLPRANPCDMPGKVGNGVRAAGGNYPASKSLARGRADMHSAAGVQAVELEHALSILSSVLTSAMLQCHN